jgi:predicted nucleic acid-binding protein
VLLNETTRTRLLEITRGSELRAPGSLPWEIGNACSALIKRGRLDADGAAVVLSSFQKVPIQLASVDMDEAMRLAAEHHLYAYDAYMIVCARRHRTPLLTLDAALARTASKVGIEVLEV